MHRAWALGTGGVACALAVLAACSGGPTPGAAPPLPPAAAALPIAAPPAPVFESAILLAPEAALRDCPPGLLARLAPSWTELIAGEPATPQLDACLRGTLRGPSVAVYTSAPPPSARGSDPWLARRLVVDGDGALLAEGPWGGGSAEVAPAALEALVDLDGDGIHEIVESEHVDATTVVMRVYRVDGEHLVDVGGFVAALSDGEHRCAAHWRPGPVGDSRGRVLIVNATEDGAVADAEWDESLRCLAPGAYGVRLEAGALVVSAEPLGP